MNLNFIYRALIFVMVAACFFSVVRAEVFKPTGRPYSRVFQALPMANQQYGILAVDEGGMRLVKVLDMKPKEEPKVKALTPTAPEAGTQTEKPKI